MLARLHVDKQRSWILHLIVQYRTFNGQLCPIVRTGLISQLVSCLSACHYYVTHSPAAKLCSELKLIRPEEETQAHHTSHQTEVQYCRRRCRRATCPDLKVPHLLQHKTAFLFFAKATSLTVPAGWLAGWLAPAFKQEWWSGHCEQNVGQPQLWGNKGQVELKGSRSWSALHHFQKHVCPTQSFPNFHHMPPHQ